MKANHHSLSLLIVFFALCVTNLSAQTWQRTYPNVSSVNSVTQAIDEGYILGATLSTGNGVLIKIDEDGNEVWRREIPSSKGMIIQALIADTTNKCYYFAGTEGFIYYLGRWPYWDQMKKPATALIGKLKDNSEMEWLKKDIVDKGYEKTSYERIITLRKYVIVSGFTSSVKKNICESFLHVYDKSTGNLAKDIPLKWYADFDEWGSDSIIYTYLNREKDEFYFRTEVMNGNLTSVIKKEGTPVRTLSISTSGSNSYVMAPVSNIAFATILFNGYDMVNGGMKNAVQTIMLGKDKVSYPETFNIPGCGMGCMFEKGILDQDGYQLFIGKSGCSWKDKSCNLAYMKSGSFFNDAVVKNFSYGDYNPSEKSKYPSTVGYDICTTRDGGALIVGFATDVSLEYKGDYNLSNRKGWVIKIDSNGNL